MPRDPDHVMKRGDTGPNLAVRLEEPDDTVKNLTGASVTFKMALQPHEDEQKVDSPATIQSAQEGEVVYEWDTDDTDEAGFYYAEFEVENADGSTETYPNTGYITVAVKDDIN